MADTLTLKEVELDYEAEEVEEPSVTPTPGGASSSPVPEEEDDGELPSSPARQTDDICSEPGEGEQGEADDGELEEGEELEDGEISDEDEALKTERLEPKPVCRFFSKGQCTWGQSCRLVFKKDILINRTKLNFDIFSIGEGHNVKPYLLEGVLPIFRCKKMFLLQKLTSLTT